VVDAFAVTEAPIRAPSLRRSSISDTKVTPLPLRRSVRILLLPI